MTPSSPGARAETGWLDFIERQGNRLPPPALLFMWLCLALILLSALSAALGLEASLPSEQGGAERRIAARSLLSGEGIRWILTHTVENFVGFAPVGSVLVAILGLGIAEQSGLLRLLLERLVAVTPRLLLSWVVVFAGIMSNLALDAGYVVLIPLAGLLFAAAGRPPLAGIAAAFAGVSAGYSANLLLGPVDAILAGMSTEAVALVADDYTVSVAGNYYFAAASTLVLSLVATLVTERWVMPHLAAQAREPSNQARTPETAQAPVLAGVRRGLWALAAWTLVFGLVLFWASVPESGLLRDPGAPGLINSALVQGVVVLLALYFAVAGWLFGRISGSFQSGRDVIAAMETTMSTMAGYLVLMFFAAQFVNYFAWSQLGSLLAALGAQTLSGWALPSSLLLVVFVLLAAFINLFVGSASAKWGLLAPVFVPMLYLLGISPEAAQMAYRIGDSSTNIITPLMPYFGVVVAFAQRYRPELGIGTLVAMMLPYSLAFLVSWTGLLLAWFFLGWSLGPGAPMLLP